jgi:hypothetical protein
MRYLMFPTVSEQADIDAERLVKAVGRLPSASGGGTVYQRPTIGSRI